MTADPKDWIAVAALPQLGPASIKRLWENGWTPDRLLQASPLEWQRLNLKEKTCSALHKYQTSAGGAVHDAVQSALRWQSSLPDAHILPITHPDYPALLRDIHDPPPVLFVRGCLEILGLPQVAIVGSRSASQTGIRQSYTFASDLVKKGLVISSGLALGVDASAHQACVDSNGPTIAVFGTGADRLYPPRNRQLALDILTCGGAWVSEFFPGAAPLASHFPRRNRVISGMSSGVLVVEAAPKSGSLITARMAVEQGREVFAIPGPLNSPLSRGCHLLIKEGAVLAENSQDIVHELSSLLGLYSESEELNHDPVAIAPSLTEEEDKLVALIGYEIGSIDQISVSSGMSIAELGPLLVEMELKGLIEQRDGGYICS